MRRTNKTLTLSLGLALLVAPALMRAETTIDMRRMLAEPTPFQLQEQPNRLSPRTGDQDRPMTLPAAALPISGGHRELVSVIQSGSAQFGIEAPRPRAPGESFLYKARVFLAA